jgi:hypothetical protein
MQGRLFSLNASARVQQMLPIPGRVTAMIGRHMRLECAVLSLGAFQPPMRTDAVAFKEHFDHVLGNT